MNRYFLVAIMLITAHACDAAQVREKIIDAKLTSKMHKLLSAHHIRPKYYPRGYEDVCKELRKLFEGEKIPDINSRKNYDPFNPLINAVFDGYTELTKTLIQLGADINARSEGEHTALWNACTQNFSGFFNSSEEQILLIELLIANGADEPIFEDRPCYYQEALQAAIKKREQKRKEYEDAIANQVTRNSDLIPDLAALVAGYACERLPRAIMPDVPQEVEQAPAAATQVAEKNMNSKAWCVIQ